MEQSLREQITGLACRMREDALLMAYHAGAGAAHVGGGLSHIDILAVLYGSVMKLDKENPQWEGRDRFILSKGHGVLGYYAALAETGYITREELKTFEKSGSFLLGHPVKNRKKGIEFTTGSLGMGLSLGIGVALAMRKQVEMGSRQALNKVYVLMGDGECNEGSTWESFLSAPQYRLDNVTAIIDRNGYQLGGKTEEVMDVGDIAAKLMAFGWDVREVDGHDVEAVYEAFMAPVVEGKPRAIVAHTVKGNGFSFCADNNAWHHAVLTKEQYETALSEIPFNGRKTEELEKSLDMCGGGLSENLSDTLAVVPLKTFDCVLQDSEIAGEELPQPVITVSKSLARRWSMVGQRAAFGLAAVELVKTNDKLMTLTGDVSTSAGLERMKKNYPAQFLDIGIAEQNMMGIAAGLASEGLDIVTATFAPFQSMRCLEQIRVNLGYMESKVTMVGLASGLVLGTLGNTHCCFEDIGVLRSIPNIAVISPADCMEVGKALEAAVKYPHSVYIRLMGGANCPVIYQEDYSFEIGRAVTLKSAGLKLAVSGSDTADFSQKDKNIVTIIAAGTMVKEALKAADILEEKGMAVEVINMHTIKPIDAGAVKQACLKSKCIAAVEEHNVIGGLGTAVAEVMSGIGKKERQMLGIQNMPELIVIGLPDVYGHGGEYKDLLEESGLTAEAIAERLINE